MSIDWEKIKVKSFKALRSICRHKNENKHMNDVTEFVIHVPTEMAAKFLKHLTTGYMRNRRNNDEKK